MGEQFYCPGCDHVDSAIGECPACGGSLKKLEVDSGDLLTNNPQKSGAEYDYVPGQTAGFDDYEDNEFDEEGMQTTY